MRAYSRVRAYTRLPTANPPHVFEGRPILSCTLSPPPPVPSGAVSDPAVEPLASRAQPRRRRLGADEAHRVEHGYALRAAQDGDVEDPEAVARLGAALLLEHRGQPPPHRDGVLEASTLDLGDGGVEQRRRGLRVHLLGTELDLLGPWRPIQKRGGLPGRLVEAAHPLL